MKNKFTLEGKTILVAGAAGRIGQEIVSGALACGANVIAIDNNVENLRKLENKTQNKEQLFCLEVDITDVKSIQNIILLSEERYGLIDGAVNTAYPRNANYGNKFFEVTYNDFCENLSLHLGSYFLFMQQCAKYSVDRQKKFSLVNLSSIYGTMPPRFDIYEGTPMTMPVEYAAIKAALLQITRYTNAFMKGKPFRANCVSPGGILAGQDNQFLQKYNDHCMTKGMLDSADIVGTIIYLLSDAAEFVAGQNIIIDDGFSL